MTNLHSLFITLILAAAFCFAAVPVRALDPALPPGGNFDLSHWYLQLPTSNGILTGTSGNVDTASTAQLLAGFTNAYFYTGPDGAMTFWAPDNGAHTSSSGHPRSELRELLDPNDEGVDWNVYGTHTMSAQLKVLQVPSDTGEVCIGQVHEDGGADIPVVFIAYDNGKIHADIWTNAANNSDSVTYQYGNSSLGSNITYQVQVVNGLVSVVINGVTNSANLLQSAPGWPTNLIYFKAGDYNQTLDTCNCSTDGATVAFYALTRSHAPSITNQPVSRVALAGTNVTFNVGALDWTNMTYRWWLNATNSLAGATNASLTITNVSVVNVGNYTVVVSDGFGSVTSSVATLTGKFPPVIIGQPAISEDRNSLTLTGTGAASQTDVLWTATNLVPPIVWTPLATNLTGNNGVFSFTNLPIKNPAQRFYQVAIP